MAADSSTLPSFFLVRSLSDFLAFWYWKSSKDFWQREIRFIKGVERDIGILINLKLLFEPIFSDYTAAGRMIGPVFRLLRVFFGCVCVLFFSGLILFAYALWLLLPPLVAGMIFRNLFFLLAG